jgi:hypothetical protein
MQYLPPTLAGPNPVTPVQIGCSFFLAKNDFKIKFTAYSLKIREIPLCYTITIVKMVAERGGSAGPHISIFERFLNELVLFLC